VESSTTSLWRQSRRKSRLPVFRRFIGLSALSAVTMGVCAAAADNASFDHVSCNGTENEIRLTVTNVKEAFGRITADLYRNDPENFLSPEGRDVQVKFAAKAPVTQFCITAPSPGQYAIAVYHDENANNRFDKGAFGLPAEPWGLSLDPKVRFGPPPIEKTLFEVGEDGTSVSLSLRH